jgi:septal ring factor EnvC (AmiA/AmiB activator)
MYQEAVQNTSKPVKKNMALFVVIGILAAALIGLGVFYFIESGNLKTDISNLESDVAALETDVASKQANINSLQTQLTNEKAIVASLEEDLAEEQANVSTLQGQLADTTSQLNTSQAEVTRLESDLEASIAEVTNLESELATAITNVASLESDLEAALAEVASLQSQLSEIQAKYPLKDFSSLSTLQQWLNEHVQTDTSIYVDEVYSMALNMQMLAAEDGYFVSACFVPNDITNDGYYYVYNTALVGDILYSFGPDDTEIYSWGEWGR